jgi:hypothetical protein
MQEGVQGGVVGAVLHPPSIKPAAKTKGTAIVLPVPFLARIVIMFRLLFKKEKIIILYHYHKV